MSDKAPVLWTEGMLLSPQHLQQQTRYFDNQLEARLRFENRLSWGVLNVEFDEQLLRANRVGVIEFTAVLPDGTVLQLETGDTALPPSRPIDNHFPPTQNTLDVYIAIAQERVGVPSATDEKGGRSRFVTLNREVSDSQADAEPRNVRVAVPNPVILFGDEPRAGYVTLKIAEVVRDDANELIVSPPYIPPSLQVSASPFLMSSLRSLFSSLRTRRTALASAQRERDGVSVEYGASDITRFLLLNEINSFIPVARYLSENGDLHPRDTYLTLARFAGALASFASSFDPAELDPYVHTDLRLSFEGLFARISSLLHASMRQNFVALALEGRSDGMFFGKMDDQKWNECRDFYLGVRSDGLASQDVLVQLPRLAKVASWQDVNSILTAASPGAPLQSVLRPPPQLPVRSGVSYFSVNTQNQFWNGISQQRQIAVFLPRPFEHLKTQVTLLGIPT